MANNKPPTPKSNNHTAYTVNLHTNGTSKDEDWSVHQSSPCWVLSFVRWSVRDTLRTKPTDTQNFSTTRHRDPLVVENDCVQCSVTVNKSTLTDSMSATLMMTDVNYETDVAPGDFVFVNMLNWPSESRRVADAARARQAINNKNDGFKGIFKVQSVRKSLTVDPATGEKVYSFNITGFSFTEFNNTIYFNQELLDKPDKENVLLFASNIGSNWALLNANKQTTKGTTNVQDWIENLVDIFLGKGIGDNGKTNKQGVVKSANTLFYIPQIVGELLGVSGAKAAKDIYNFFLGIQQYSGSATQGMATGMNPTGFETDDNRFYVPADNLKCQGETVTKPEYWDQVKLWSILNQFTNAPLNELFTCFKIDPTGSVMPTMVFRQIPFTNEDFKAGEVKVTRFLTLPRWHISPALVLRLDLGRDEAARINFVQYFSTSAIGPDGWSTSAQTAAGNYLYDIDDVKRSGLRPYIISTSFALKTDDKGNIDTRAVQWSRIIGDALIGQHLKMNGTIECIGIVDPIAVGDNLEFDGVVYHIEQITHTCSISPDNGLKSFRTSISVSNGVSRDSNAKGTQYTEMTFSSAYALRDNDSKNNQILPGVSESQDVVYRPNDPDSASYSPNGPFQQPNNNTSVEKTGVENQFNEKNKK